MNIRRRQPALRSRSENTLRLSLYINLFYFTYKAVAAILYRSAWIGASAFYYVVLSLTRFHLLRGLRLDSRYRRKIRRKYHLCGWMLMLLTIAIGTIGGHSVLRGEFNHYPGHLIYAAACYTFYSLSMAITNLIRMRGSRNPLHKAAKILSLASAMTAMFSLQCTMIARFGSDVQFQSIMNTITGLFVFIASAAMSAYMILDRQ